MERDDDRARTWLVTEQRDDEEADAAFGAVFTAMPRLDPSPTFARRVARTARRLVKAPTARRAPWILRAPGGITRAAAAAGLAAVAIVIVYFAATAIGSLLATRLPQLVTGATQAFIWLMVAVDSGLDLWAIVARVGRALGSAAATPGMTVGLIVIEVLGGAALFALYRLLASEQEPDRGDSFQLLRRS